MNSSTLFSWSLKKTSLPVLLIIFVVCWRHSSSLYRYEVSSIENELRSQLLNSISMDLDSISYNYLNITVLNSKGSVVFDTTLGSRDGGDFSVPLKRALAGESFITYETSSKNDLIVLWSPYTYNSEASVIVLSKVNGNSRLYLMLYCVLTDGLVILLILLACCYMVMNQIGSGVLSAQRAVEGIESENFTKGEYPLQNDEFGDLYKSINSLNEYVETEFLKLRKGLKQWEVFFSTIPRGLVTIDDEKNILSCNNNALDLLKIKNKAMSEVVSHSIVTTFENADINRITSEFFKSDQYLEEYEFEIMSDNILETIKVICVELNISEHSEKPGALMILENITSLRRLENMRKDFVSNVSHELKTPISIIGGFAETLKECLDDPESAKRFIGIIEKNTVRLSLIIDDLLNLSKLEQNEVEIKKDFESKDVRETIKAALDVCSHEATKKKITINLSLEDTKYYDQGDMLANHRLLEQAFRNLIENAIRYSPANSEVFVTTHKVKDDLVISIRDEGPGIPEEHHEKIFERFYRVDKSRDRQTGGSGLGLAIVKHIARIHDGTVVLESKPESGACFTVTLPYNIKAESSAITY